MTKCKKDSLGDRMKTYEAVSKNYLTRRIPVIIRLDGKAFHTFTRGLNKPFDGLFMKLMQDTMLDLCNEIQGCVLGYTQSDEITLVLIDYQNRDTCAWFDNQVQKMVSVSSSLATLFFNKHLSKLVADLRKEVSKIDDGLSVDLEYIKQETVWEGKEFRAIFDSRVFNIPQYEVCNNLIWRQQDATRNSINSVAQSLFSHKEIQGINTKDIQNKMLIEKDVNWNNFPTSCKRGCCAIKDEEGKWFVDTEIPIFTEDRDYIDKLVFID